MITHRLVERHPSDQAANSRECERPAAATDGRATLSRKADHLRINVEEDVAAKGLDSGLDAYRFLHLALPEIDLADVDPSTELFGRRLGAPLLISCMTGGTVEAERINVALAEVAQEFALAMGLGSGRVLLERPAVLPSFNVRRVAPSILLFCNLGAVQLNRGLTIDDCKRLVDQTGADALVLHLNPLQEAVQPEGDTCFAGLLERIHEVCQGLDVPVVAKEVGWGLAPDVVRALLDAGVAAVDVAGAGGTSWSEVERHRLPERWRARVAAAFCDWGIPTADAVRAARRAAPEARIFASGGLRDGIDAAKALALGADLVGLAGPFLRAVAEGGNQAADLARELIETIRIAMFCVGARSIPQLQGTPRLVPRDRTLPCVYREQLSYHTPGGGEFIDVVDDVAAVVRRAGIRQGFVHVYSHHTTAAIRVNENEPLLLGDFQRLLGRIAPAGGYDHDDLERRVGTPKDEPLNGHAHCRHLLLATSETIPIVDGKMALGPWQRIFLIELCSARQRQVTVQVIGE